MSRRSSFRKFQAKQKVKRHHPLFKNPRRLKGHFKGTTHKHRLPRVPEIDIESMPT